MGSGRHIEGLGDPALPVKLVPGFDFASAVLSPQEGFVLSRVDGKANADTICLLTGLGPNTTLDILRRLRAQGIIVLGDEAPVRSEIAATGGAMVSESVRIKLQSTEQLEEDEADREVELKPEVRKRIRDTFARLGDMNFFQLLGADLEAEEKELRRAYFKRSKEFHPDRFFGKNLGRYKEMIGEIFKQISSAYQFLEDEDNRRSYRATLRQERYEVELARHVENVAANPGGGAPIVERQRYASGEYTYSRAAGLRRREVVQTSESVQVPPVREARSSATFPRVEDPRKPRTGEAARARSSSAEIQAPQPEDPAEARRREEDRARRRRYQAMAPAATARNSKAKDYFTEGVRQLGEGKALAAAANLKLAMTLAPDVPEYRARYEEAMEQSRGTTAEGLFKRAAFEESAGRYEAAGKLYVRAADLHPIAPHLMKAAQAMLWAEDLIKAKDYATKAVQIDPSSAEARIALARVYVAAGLRKNAIREAEAALGLDARNADAKSLLKEIKRQK